MTLKTILTAATLTLAAATSVFAADVSAEDAAHVTEILTAQGYDVRSVKLEDGLFEAYTIKDGQMAEIFLNPNFEIIEGASDNDN